MKSKWSLFSSIFQIVVGIFAILAFILISSSGGEITKWSITLVLAIAYVVTGIIGIIDYKKQ